MHDRRRREFPLRPAGALPAALILLAALLAGTGCARRAERTLRPSDLTPSERLYVERFVTLERARAIALADSARGTVVLDSLRAAWGDSSLAPLLTDLPRSPRRLAALHDLIGRLLAAERDSLLAHPDHPGRRLGAPLPPPAPPGGPLSGR